jgi:hypothetical protein
MAGEVGFLRVCGFGGFPTTLYARELKKYFLEKYFLRRPLKRAETNPPHPQTRRRSWRDVEHAIDVHIDVAILPRPQDEHALAAANWIVDVLFQAFADGF